MIFNITFFSQSFSAIIRRIFVVKLFLNAVQYVKYTKMLIQVQELINVNWKNKKRNNKLVVTSVTIYDISKQILGCREIFFYQDHCFH